MITHEKSPTVHRKQTWIESTDTTSFEKVEAIVTLNPVHLGKLRGRLVIEFKNCCLKRCENCSLKNVIEIHVFSVYKTKKCVWYHGLNNMFQCSKT